MPAMYWMAGLGLLAFVVPAAAETVHQVAENHVPVVMVQIDRRAAYTEVRLQTLAALDRVCWNANGPNSPYLIAGSQRYRFLGGENIANCPTSRSYGSGDIMVLRFAPLPSNAHEVSLVEGEGGEEQMTNPGQSRVRFWNFLHVALH